MSKRYSQGQDKNKDKDMDKDVSFVSLHVHFMSGRNTELPGVIFRKFVLFLSSPNAFPWGIGSDSPLDQIVVHLVAVAT
jgi:hypothetical protein